MFNRNQDNKDQTPVEPHRTVYDASGRIIPYDPHVLPSQAGYGTLYGLQVMDGLAAWQNVDEIKIVKN